NWWSTGARKNFSSPRRTKRPPNTSKAAMGDFTSIVKTQSRASDWDPSDDDSAVTVLRTLEAGRHSLFGEGEYHKYRQSVLDELARGTRCRPFTLVTFAVVGTFLFA